MEKISLKLTTHAVTELLDNLSPELVLELQQSVIANIARRIMPQYLNDIIRHDIDAALRANKKELIEPAAIEAAVHDAVKTYVGYAATTFRKGPGVKFEGFALSVDAMDAIRLGVRAEADAYIKEQLQAVTKEVKESFDKAYALIKEQTKLMAEAVVEDVSVNAIHDQVQLKMKEIADSFLQPATAVAEVVKRLDAEAEAKELDEPVELAAVDQAA